MFPVIRQFGRSLPERIITLIFAASAVLLVSILLFVPEAEFHLIKFGVEMGKKKNVNLALNKIASSSSAQQGSQASDVVDGRRNHGSSGFATLGPDKDKELWWEVDLGNIYPLENIMIFSGIDSSLCCSALETSLSQNHKSWEIVSPGKEIIRDSKKILRIDLLASSPLLRQARYIRLRQKETENVPLRLNEVEVWGSKVNLTEELQRAAVINEEIKAGTLVNHALNKPATMSETLPGTVATPEGAVDGKLDSYPWSFATRNTTKSWWQVDLQAMKAIREIRIYNSIVSPDAAETLEVLISGDGAIWNRVFANDGEVFSKNVGLGYLSIPLEAEARYVKARLNSKNHLHLNEVEVWGNP